MSVKIFIAGASREAPRVRLWMANAKAHGLAVARDWLAHIDAVGHACPDDEDAQAKALAANWQAIRESAIVWLLAPESESRDSWAELGFAVGRGECPVVSSGPAAFNSITCSQTMRFASDEDAFGWIVEYARRVA